MRNREPILAVLRPLLRAGAEVLEIAAGSGEHAVFFAERMPDVLWQPSDLDPEALASIAAHRAEAGLPNLRAPLAIDASRGDFGDVRVDLVLSANMIHIAPWAACVGLIRGAARALSTGGILFLYGPFRIAGEPFAPSNVAFDESLRGRDPSWGVRDLDAVLALAEEAGFAREALVAMPANNHSLVLKRLPAAS
ncbi:SAM-dependent methyltransferase [Minicystis rosea]|nr:SAM-dependent methyltransferase [Minicystis rosea]